MEKTENRRKFERSGGFIHIMSDMRCATVSTRRFTKEFSTFCNWTVQVTYRGIVVGQWTPAPKTPEPVDFFARATLDTKGKLEFTGAELLREGKKR
jgi:hypothetical protein